MHVLIRVRLFATDCVFGTYSMKRKRVQNNNALRAEVARHSSICRSRSRIILAHSPPGVRLNIEFLRREMRSVL
jgi:hypothetical protein